MKTYYRNIARRWVLSLQRVGRISRQGNNNKEVHIYNYVTEQTFDSYLYQTIENKQKFISQIMTSKEIARRFSDIDETVLNYAEIKALCSGNPLIKVKLDLEKEINNLEIMRRSHTFGRHRLEDMVNTKGPKQWERNKSYAENIKKDLEILKRYPYNKDNKDNKESCPAFFINGKEYTNKKEAGAALMAALKKLAGSIGNTDIGSYRNFAMNVRYSFVNSNFEITLKNHHSYIISTGTSEDGNITRINNALSEVALIETLERFESNIKNIEQEIETAKKQLQHDFPQEAEYQEKLVRLEKINKELGIGLDKELEKAGEKEKSVELEAKKPKNSIAQIEDKNQIKDADLAKPGINDVDIEDAEENGIPSKVVSKSKKAYEMAI